MLWGPANGVRELSSLTPSRLEAQHTPFRGCVVPPRQSYPNSGQISSPAVVELHSPKPLAARNLLPASPLPLPEGEGLVKAQGV
jgi:hypothetical protein